MTENTENWSVLFVYNFKIQYFYHLESLLSQALIKLKAESLTAAGARTVQGFACSGHAELQKIQSFKNTITIHKWGQKYCKTLSVHKTCRGSHYNYFGRSWAQVLTETFCCTLNEPNNLVQRCVRKKFFWFITWNIKVLNPDHHKAYLSMAVKTPPAAKLACLKKYLTSCIIR